MPETNEPQSNLPALPTLPPVPRFTDQPCVFGTLEQFELGQRMARALASSDMVPTQFKDKTANCMIALDIAMQRRVSPLTVMQNLSIIQGRPAWSASFVIASINASGLFSPLRYEWQGEQGHDAWGCRAVATDLRTGDRLEGTMITIALAKAEGWYGRTGSKWQTMPEQMLRYRAGAFFGRIYAGHITLGLQTQDEVVDGLQIDVTPSARTVDTATGEIAQPGNGAQEAQAAEPARAPRRPRRRDRETIEGQVAAAHTPLAEPVAVAPSGFGAPAAPAPARAAPPLEPLEIPDSGLEPAPPRSRQAPPDDPLF